MKLKIAIAQMAIALGQPEVNQATVKKYAQQAAAAEADVLVLPEMWSTGYAFEQLTTIADQGGARSQGFLSEIARQYQLNIVGGSVATQQGTSYYNTMYVVDDQGQRVSSYHKAHLFGLMAEEQYLAAGEQINTFTLAGVPAAGVICYDIRFPEWLRTMMAQGPQQILYVVAEWPIQRIAQWQILLQARAIENQTFVVAANRVGHDANNQFGGRSLVIDPLGQIIQQADDNDKALLVVTIDTADEQAVRGQIPVFHDRRPALYD